MNKKRNIFVTAMAVMLAAVFFACKEPVPVTGVTLDQTTVNMMPGESVTLKAAVEPANATVKTVNWVVVAQGRVYVTDHKDGRCTVKAENEDEVVVTAVTADGGRMAHCQLSVLWPRIDNLYLINKVESQTAAAGAPVGWTKEIDGTVKLTPENRETIRTVTELKFSGSNCTDLSGIEHFTGLTYLSCAMTSLTSLNVSGRTALTTLVCRNNNQLTSLDVSNCPALTTLECDFNQLEELDISNCPALTTLRCDYNQLEELDVSNCPALTTLWCYGNPLKELDITAVSALDSLKCYGAATLILTEEQVVLWEDKWKNDPFNKSVSIKVTGSPAVSGVTPDRGDFDATFADGTVTLTATVKPDWAADKTVSWSVEPQGVLALTDNGDGSCGVKPVAAGEAVVTVTTVSGGKTAEVRVRVFEEAIKNSNFISAVGDQCQWTKTPTGLVCLSPENKNRIQSVEELNLSGKGLTNLSGIEYFTGLKRLNCSANKLQGLELSANTALTNLNCSDNQLLGLHVSKNEALVELLCTGNQLKTLDVSANTKLVSLFCGKQTTGRLTLTLTQTQKTLWISDWGNKPDNADVDVRDAN